MQVSLMYHVFTLALRKLRQIKFVKCGLLELPSVHKFMAPKALKEYILSFKGALVPCGAERKCWRVKV